MGNGTGTKDFRWEIELAAPVSRYLRNRKFRLQGEEVPFFENRMDVYGYSKHADQTIAVELKLKRWHRALEQALLYQLCSDLVYIAMPAAEVGRVDVTALSEHGVGLIAVGQSRCREILAARPSTVLRSHYREEYLQLLRGED